MSEHQPLSAELCARAIVASAKAFGDDPLKAIAAKRGVHRRCMAPAAIAVLRATSAHPGTVARIMQVGVQFQRAPRGQGHEAALTQALLAIGGARLALEPDVPEQSDEAIEGEFTVVETKPAPNPRNGELLRLVVRKRAEERRQGVCSWIEDGGDRCGRPTPNKRPFCLEHAKKAYVPGSSRVMNSTAKRYVESRVERRPDEEPTGLDGLTL